MINYNQKYKNDVIVTVSENNGNPFDSTVSDNRFFSAIGQQTSGNVNNVSQVKRINVWAVKPDTILNLEDGFIKVYDDNGLLTNINLSGLSNNQWSTVGSNLTQPLRLGTRDTNIRFDNFNSVDGMTQNISDLMNSENISSFNLKTTTPSDVTCNYTTGSHLYIKTQSK